MTEKWREAFDAHLWEWVRGTSDAAVSFDHATANLCESEIERMMLAELMFMDFGYDPGPHIVHDVTMPFPIPAAGVVILPQFSIGKYRADFALLINFAGHKMAIVIECDGHDFHERTKAQAQRDKKRDRDLQRAGWQVFRFTGSEIYKDAKACVREIADHIAAKIGGDGY